MNTKIKIIIFFLVFLLIIINILFVIFNKKASSKKAINSSISPTSTFTIDNKNKIYPTFSESKRNINTNSTSTKTPIKKNEEIDRFYQEKIFPKLTFFNQDEISKWENFIKKTPIEEKNYSIYYSPILNKVYLKPKNSQGEKEIEALMRNYQIEKIVKKYPQNFILDQNITQEKIIFQEINFLKNQETSLSTSQQNYNQQNLLTPPQTSPLPDRSEEINPLSSLVVLMRILMETSQFQETDSTQNFLSPTLSPSSLHYSPPTIVTNLTQLFNDVGKQVGVPPKILEGVMTIEMPSTFRYSNDQIALYSQPGSRIPGCGPNVCSATGPMQMTIGIDNSGSTQCTKCGLTSCPNAWARYGNAIQIFTGSNHTPDPCNLRDNVYGAAYKLKTDSGASDPLNWTQEQVYRAGTRYYGSCADRYRYPRLGNRTYCEFLWWYYTNK